MAVEEYQTLVLLLLLQVEMLTGQVRGTKGGVGVAVEKPGVIA